MNKTILISCCLSLLMFYSCTSKPSNADIEKKILMEYTCFETAKVNTLDIINSKDAEAISGATGFEYTVSGEIIWPKGCNEFGNIPPGFTEKFQNKKIFLIKVDGNWQ